MMGGYGCIVEWLYCYIAVRPRTPPLHTQPGKGIIYQMSASIKPFHQRIILPIKDNLKCTFNIVLYFSRVI